MNPSVILFGIKEEKVTEEELLEEKISLLRRLLGGLFWEKRSPNWLFLKLYVVFG
jgi:hypothetical protein